MGNCRSGNPRSDFKLAIAFPIYIFEINISTFAGVDVREGLVEKERGGRMEDIYTGTYISV